MTDIACFTFCRWIFTIDCFSKDPRTGCLPNATRSAKQKCMCKLVVLDSVFKCGRNMFLAHNRIESLWPVFPRGDYKFFHNTGAI